MKVNFGSIVVFPEVLFSGSTLDNKNLINARIERDHIFPNDETDSKYGLTDATFKVTLVSVEDSNDKYRSYWSDLKQIIKKYNPEAEFQGYPKELL